MRACREHGLTTYDFLAPATRYKQELSTRAERLVWAELDTAGAGATGSQVPRAASDLGAQRPGASACPRTAHTIASRRLHRLHVQARRRRGARRARVRAVRRRARRAPRRADARRPPRPAAGRGRVPARPNRRVRRRCRSTRRSRVRCPPRARCSPPSGASGACSTTSTPSGCSGRARSRWLFAAQTLLRRRALVLGVRQDTIAYVRSRHRADAGSGSRAR